MLKPVSFLFLKIAGWFFLNLAILAAGLGLFFFFDPQLKVQTFFRQQIFNRLKTAGILIGHDLRQTSMGGWEDVLKRHAKVHNVDFVLVIENGPHYRSYTGDIPEAVLTRVQEIFRRKPPPPFEFKRHRNKKLRDDIDGDPVPKKVDGKTISREIHDFDKRLKVILYTKEPRRYWTGMWVPLFIEKNHSPLDAVLMAVSDSITGHGFFFDPLPWMFVTIVVIVISLLLWIPMVKNITQPLVSMTQATEEIARGRFDVSISESRKDEIGRLAKAINHMAARLAAFVYGQKRFLGDVAHELGSPIARIQFGLGALEQRIHGEGRQLVQDVVEDVEHMSKLVNELLAFTRAEMNVKTVKLEPVELLPVVDDAIRREANGTVRIITHIDSGIRVYASAELLTRAFANLVRNAVKYANAAGPVYISAKNKKDHVVIEVRDAGPGVPETFLDQLFEPFFRPEPSRDRDSGGVGLGLTIVKTCIETCQGTVTARNLKPHGFAVTVTCLKDRKQ